MPPITIVRMSPILLVRLPTLTHSRTLAALRRLPLIAVIALFAVGCSRKFFRERADRDVEGLLTDKNNDPRWALDNWHVYPDARARFAE